jgi:hypothetical protein
MVGMVNRTQCLRGHQELAGCQSLVLHNLAAAYQGQNAVRDQTCMYVCMYVCVYGSTKTLPRLAVRISALCLMLARPNVG